MKQNRIELLITAKNALTKTLGAIGKTVSSFGHGIVNAGKWMAAGFSAVGGAILAAAYQAEAFNKKVGQISTLTTIPIRTIKKEVIALSAEFGLAKDEVTKGLYDALSAGVPKENVFEFMRVASKTAIGGAASTAEAVDILTTALNSFKIPADQAGKVADALFTTVRLGKTTVAELAQSFAQAGPIAAASGIKIEELFSAIATLTKQGVKTPEAMTQIKAAIKAMNDVLGDGWASAMSLQEGFEEMSRRAGGSQKAIVELTGRVEGAMAIFATTGKNAKGAAEDLDQLRMSGGEADKAFGKMKGNFVFDKLRQSINGVMLSAGDAALTLLAPTILKAAKAVKTFGENVVTWMESKRFKELQTTIEGVISSMSKGGKERSDVGKALVNVVISGFAVAAQGAVNIIMAAAPVIGRMIGAAFNVVWENVKPITRSERNAAAEQLGIEKDSFGLKPKITWSREEYRREQELLDAKNKLIDATVKNNRIKKAYADAGVDEAEADEKQTEAKRKLAASIDILKKTVEKYNAAVADVPEPEVPPTPTEITSGGAGGIELDGDKWERYAEEKAKTAQELADLAVDIAEEQANKEREIREKAWQDEKALNEKRLAAAQDLAKKRVAEVIEEAKAQKDFAKAQEDDQKKAKRLLANVGGKMSRLTEKDRAFVEAANQIKNAKAAIPAIKGQIEVANDNLTELKNHGRKLDDMLKKQAELIEYEKKLLAMG